TPTVAPASRRSEQRYGDVAVSGRSTALSTLSRRSQPASGRLWSKSTGVLSGRLRLASSLRFLWIVERHFCGLRPADARPGLRVERELGDGTRRHVGDLA